MKQKKKQRKIIATLDIETPDGLKGKEFGLGCVLFGYHYDTKILIIERDYKIFFKKIFDFSKQYKNVLCFIQNEDFDIRFLLKYCIDELAIYPFVIQSNSSILEVRIPEFNIIFRDSLQFLLCGQAEAEKTYLGKQIKKTVDFDKTYKKLKDPNTTEIEKEKIWRELEERVISDVEGLRQVMFKFKELMFSKFKLNIFSFVTLPAFSIKAFAKRLKKDTGNSLIKLNPYIKFENFRYEWESEQKKSLYYWTRRSYFGGRCEVFNLDYLKKVYYYDFNSLYPSVCITKKFPNPTNSVIMEFPTIEFFIDEVKDKRLYLIEAEVSENIEYPILPLRDNKGIKFVNGKKTGVWASPIFNRFLEFEDNRIIKIIRLRIYIEQEDYFKNFMTDRYYNRVEYKQNNDSANAESEKVVANSLTGKPAQKPLRENWVLFNQEIYNDIITSNKEIDIIEFTEKYRLIKVVAEVLKDFQIVDWTVFITAYAQEHYHRTIYKLKEYGIKVFYGDTDCLFVSQPLEKNKELIDLIGLDVMQLKNELIKPSKHTLNRANGNYINKETLEEISPPYFDQAKFYLPKVYILKKDKQFQVIAKGISLFMLYETLGIPLNKNSDSKELFNQKIESFEQAEYLLFNTGVYTNRYLKYRSSLRQNNDLISFGRIEKTVKKIYDKRKINPDLTTKPLHSSELEDMKQIRTENLNTLLNNVKTSYVSHTVANTERNKKIKRIQ